MISPFKKIEVKKKLRLPKYLFEITIKKVKKRK